MSLRITLLVGLLVAASTSVPARAGLVLSIDGPYTVGAGQDLAIPIYVTDDGVGGPTILTDFSLKLTIQDVASASPNGLQFVSDMPSDYADMDSYVFHGVYSGPFISVNDAPPTVGPFQEVTITDFDGTFDGVQLSGRRLIAQVVVTSLPSRNGSAAPPAQPSDSFRLSFDLSYSEYNSSGSFAVSIGSDGRIDISSSAVPEPNTVLSALSGLSCLFAAHLFRRRRNRSL